MKVSFPWKAVAGMVKPLLPMQGACGQDRLGATSVSPFANSDLEKRAKFCLFQEQAMLQAALSQAFSCSLCWCSCWLKGHKMCKISLWLAPELRKWPWQLGLGESDVLSVQAKGAEAVPSSGCSWPAVLCVPVFCVTDTRG